MHRGLYRASSTSGPLSVSKTNCPLPTGEFGVRPDLGNARQDDRTAVGEFSYQR